MVAFMLEEKSQAFDAFLKYEAKVTNSIERNISKSRFDKGVLFSKI